MQKNSNSDYDGQQTQVLSLDIGKKGLDLRTNDDPDALTVLDNARFADVSSIERRTGFTSKLLQDGAPFPNGQTGVGDWVYGFGNLVTGSNAVSQHNPISSQHLGTFNYEDNDISWTGDRLLIHTKDGTPTCLGSSSYWNNSNDILPTSSTTNLPYGIPCFAPSIVDIIPPSKIIATSTEQNTHDICATETQYCIVYTSQGSIFAQIINRDTNQLISVTKLNIATTTNIDPRVIFSNNKFIAYWYDSTGQIIYTSSFSGISWSTEAVVLSNIRAWCISYPVFGGSYYLVYRTSLPANTIKARYYLGTIVQSFPFAADTTVTTTTTIPNGHVAIDVNPSGEIAIAWGASGGHYAREFSSSLTTKPGFNLVQVSTTDGTSGSGIGIISRGIANSGSYTWVVYLGADPFASPSGTKIRSFAFNGTTTVLDSVNNIRFRCQPISRPFRIGNETFIWLSSGNSPVYFLVSGVASNIVCAYADRGNAIQFTRGKFLNGICADPLDPNKVFWIRSINNSNTNANHALVSSIDFLPQITTAQYGSSIYISGSAVQNFDGTTVSDAGFQDYPTTVSGSAAAGGGLSAGNYTIRAYCVRYNNKGERFVSPALTSVAVAAAGGQKIDWIINTVQSCTATDASIEVYRTLAGGTTYFLEGSIANTGSTVTFTTTLSDAAIALNAGDPYQVQIGGLSELLENGPIGCTTIVSYNDRLWCAGGQVPKGQLVFSKLKIPNFGAGFSALTGSVIIDSEQNNITSIAGINDSLAVFEQEKLFLLDTNGPDNFGRGGFSPVKFAAKKGAITHFGTILTDIGLAYWNEGGPYLLTGNSSIVNISDNIRPLAVTLVPTGVTLNPQKQEVIWYTDTGTALLWDYKSNNRWAKWTGLSVNAASKTALAMSNGKLYLEDSTVYTDAGQVYTFSFRTGQLRAERLLSGYITLKKYGITGEFLGPHSLEFRVYYNGSPLWEERVVWTPDTQTYLTLVSDFATLTAEQVDALLPLDKSGNYSFNKRASRQNCQRFQLELLDSAPDGPSYTPLSLEFELGARPGFGRTASTVVTDK